jgi:hypothetical protein
MADFHAISELLLKLSDIKKQGIYKIKQHCHKWDMTNAVFPANKRSRCKKKEEGNCCATKQRKRKK